MLVIQLLFALASAARMDTDAAAGSRADLCDRWLLVQYEDGNDGANSSEDVTRVFGSFRYLAQEWNGEREVVLAKKQLPNGCTKTYVANCEQGGFIKKEECPGQEPSLTSKCLGGFGCLWYSRKTDLESGEVATVFDPLEGHRQMSSGKVMFSTLDPHRGVALERIARNGWKAEWGCYCCQHSYSALSNPFSFSSGRVAWSSRSGGLQECMLAWRMIGNGMNHEQPADSSVLGVLALIPEFVGTFLDIFFTGTVARHLACSATCTLREAKFEPNKYSYTKISTEFDKY
ncbi:unnamed protein product [Symbiodinium natans]|uniref:Uncharacterized protein n=1 Tax=Symbiodinium natans TaxID=878477 RepID=A0A812MGL3_9DINO|nr:unnamed protein product [Symbiodinium natans]